jgi:hypothetical protein
MIFHLILWLIVIALGATAGASAVRAVHAETPAATRSEACAGCVFAALTVIGLTVLGKLPAIPGVILAVAAALGAAVLIWMDPEKPSAAAKVARHCGRKAAGDVRRQPRILGQRARESYRTYATQRAGTLAPALVADDLAERRNAKDADRQPEPVAQAIGAPDPVRAPDPAANGRPRPVTSPPNAGPPPSGPGAVSDLLTSVHVIIMHALSGGMRGKDQGIATLTEAADQIGRAVHTFATRLSEPDQHYGAPVWEPLMRMAGMLHAASLAGGDGMSALRGMASMPLGEVAVSPAVQAPHHDELNKA